MKLLAALAASSIVSIATLGMAPATHADTYPGKITTYCGHTTRVSADSASMKVTSSSNKQARGDMTVFVKNVRTGKVVRSMTASFGGGDRTEFSFRALRAGKYKFVFSADESRFFAGCSATERLVVS